MQRTVLTLVALAAGATFGREAAAQTFISHTEWDSQYRAAGGFIMTARIKVFGTHGSYSIYDQTGRYIATGRLSGIRSRYNASGVPEVRGDWQLGSSRGFFEFTVDQPHNPQSFQGSWGEYGRNDGGYWFGTRVGGCAPNTPCTTGPQPVQQGGSQFGSNAGFQPVTGPNGYQAVPPQQTWGGPVTGSNGYQAVTPPPQQTWSGNGYSVLTGPNGVQLAVPNHGSSESDWENGTGRFGSGGR